MVRLLHIQQRLSKEALELLGKMLMLGIWLYEFTIFIIQLVSMPFYWHCKNWVNKFMSTLLNLALSHIRVTFLLTCMPNSRVLRMHRKCLEKWIMPMQFRWMQWLWVAPPLYLSLYLAQHTLLLGIKLLMQRILLSILTML